MKQKAGDLKKFKVLKVSLQWNREFSQEGGVNYKFQKKSDRRGGKLVGRYRKRKV